MHSRGWRGRSFSFGTFTNGGVLVQPPPQPPQQTLARPPYGNWRGQKPNGPPPPFHATTHSWLGNDTDSWAGSDDDGAMAAIGASPYGTVTLGHLPLPQPQQEQPQPQPQQQQPQQQQQPWGLSMLPWGPGMSNAAPPPLWLQPPSFHPTPHPALGNAATPAASATATAAAVAADGTVAAAATAAATAAAYANANANAATATAVDNASATATAAAGVAAAAAADADAATADQVAAAAVSDAANDGTATARDSRLKFVDGAALSNGKGVEAFNTLGFGVCITDQITDICHKMAAPFKGQEPPAKVGDWGFSDMEPFEVHDAAHARFSALARNANAMSGTGQKYVAARSSRSVSMPDKDQRGQAHLWSHGRSSPMRIRLDHNGDARLHQGGGITPVGSAAASSAACRSAGGRAAVNRWIHPFVETDEQCRDVIRDIGELIGGHRAGRDPAAIAFREGAEDAFQSCHTDYHHHAVRWEDGKSNPDAGEATHPDGRRRWLCEFVLHDRVLAFIPKWGSCEDVWFVYLPAGCFVYWDGDTRHGGTSHSIWRAHPNMPRRANDTVWGVAVHWYVDAYARDEVDKNGNKIGHLNMLAVGRDIKGQVHCGSTAKENTKFLLEEPHHRSSKRTTAEKKWKVTIVDPCEL